MLDHCKRRPDARETDRKMTVDDVINDPEGFADMIRAAIEAVAPAIREEALEEAAGRAVRLLDF